MQTRYLTELRRTVLATSTTVSTLFRQGINIDVDLAAPPLSSKSSNSQQYASIYFFYYMQYASIYFFYYMSNVNTQNWLVNSSHMTFSNSAYWLKIPYWPVNIFHYWLSLWCYYCDVILYYCDVILYYCLTKMSLRYYGIWCHNMTSQ